MVTVFLDPIFYGILGIAYRVHSPLMCSKGAGDPVALFLVPQDDEVKELSGILNERLALGELWLGKVVRLGEDGSAEFSPHPKLVAHATAVAAIGLDQDDQEDERPRPIRLHPAKKCLECCVINLATHSVKDFR